MTADWQVSPLLQVRPALKTSILPDCGSPEIGLHKVSTQVLEVLQNGDCSYVHILICGRLFVLAAVCVVHEDWTAPGRAERP